VVARLRAGDASPAAASVVGASPLDVRAAIPSLAKAREPEPVRESTATPVIAPVAPVPRVVTPTHPKRTRVVAPARVAATAAPTATTTATTSEASSITRELDDDPPPAQTEAATTSSPSLLERRH
jgi:hypothetical protein